MFRVEEHAFDTLTHQLLLEFLCGGINLVNQGGDLVLRKGFKVLAQDIYLLKNF
jgi:hypothetical protein